MKLLKQIMAVLGILFVVAAIVAIATPNTVHALAAALVEIVPGPATHVGQAESQLVNLVCGDFSTLCHSVDSAGNPSSTDYKVPSGYTLVITDWELHSIGSFAPNAFVCDFLLTSLSVYPIVQTCGSIDGSDSLYRAEHFATGVRVASGEGVTDFIASAGTTNVPNSVSYIQGYLVPN